MIRYRDSLDGKVVKLQSSLAAASAKQVELSAVVVEKPVPTFWDKLNPFTRQNEAEATLQSEIQLAIARVAELERKIGTALEEVAAHAASMIKHREASLERAEMRVSIRRFARRVTLIAALASLTVGIVLTTATFAGSGLALSSPHHGRVLMRADTSLASALQANPEIAHKILQRCGVGVSEPVSAEGTPDEVKPVEVEARSTFGEGADQSFQPASTYWSSIGRAVMYVAGSPSPNLLHGMRCTIGKPCGGACIPVDHTCRLSMTADVRSCGGNQVAVGKTCRPAPVVARVPASGSEATSSWFGSNPDPVATASSPVTNAPPSSSYSGSSSDVARSGDQAHISAARGRAPPG